MDVNITTIAYLRVLIIGIGSTIILMVVEAQGQVIHGIDKSHDLNFTSLLLFAPYCAPEIAENSAGACLYNMQEVQDQRCKNRFIDADIFAGVIIL